MKFISNQKSSFSIEITPLIDIVFLLVIFFVVTSKVGDSGEASKMQPENSFDLKIRMRFGGMLKNPLSLRYYVEKAFSTSFILFLLLEVLNFATDIAWNVEYYKQPEKFYQDFPASGNCIKNFTIACHFSGIYQPERSILLVSLSIFLLTYLTRFIFVMACEKTRHYLATLVGYCCWDSLKKNQQWFGCFFISLAWLGLVSTKLGDTSSEIKKKDM